MTLVATLLSACAQGRDSSLSTAVTIGVHGTSLAREPSELRRPSTLKRTLSALVTSEVFQTLVDDEPVAHRVVGGVASSWTPDARRTVWTFTVARRARFSDGTVLDAHAVVANVESWRRGARTSDVVARRIASVHAAGTQDVIVALRRPDATLAWELASPQYAIVSPSALRRVTQRRAVLGSGPYAVTEWVDGDHVTLRANRFYRGYIAHYRTVIVREVPDPPTAVLALQKHDIDAFVGEDLSDDVLERIGRDPRLRSEAISVSAATPAGRRSETIRIVAVPAWMRGVTFTHDLDALHVEWWRPAP